MTYAAHCAAIERETALFVAAVTGPDPALPVPTCPGWTLATLVQHAGTVQRWFAGLLRARVQEPPTTRDVDLSLPADPDGYPEWLAEGAVATGTVLLDTDPDAAMWTWGADP